MAIKERTLRKLNMGRSALSDLRRHGLDKTVPSVLCALKEANDLVRRGLPKPVYGEYEEIFSGIIQSLEQIPSGADMGEQTEVLSLVSELLTYIADRLKNETNFKKEIVFLPYKAEMWDSMESVWQAAIDDSDRTVAYVVPIPYFDRDPEGNVREWHCDAPKFPRYVPVIDYRRIDLEDMHPDVIVISNPYDDYNNVTSVDMKYYSRYLKGYTDKLVYIPYFVLEEVDVDNEEALDGIAHFIFSGKGVVNSDLTIVQSENMREAYIRLLTRYTDKERAYWEKRVLGLGSPKFDKILSTKREDIKLPEDWRHIIEKPDGKRKKVILYNVSLSNLYKHKDKALDKMEWVFQTFKERQDEVTLLWRPHPLFETTIHSLVPEVWDRYQNMIKCYRSEGWGIFDDSTDLDRAVVVSDGYYGDGSSLVELFRRIEKPVLLQGYSSYSYDKPAMYASSFILHEGKIWLADGGRRSLLVFDAKDASLIREISLPIQYCGGGWMNYCTLYQAKENIFIVPSMLCDRDCRTILKYDIREQIFTPVADLSKRLSLAVAFSGYVSCGRFVFFAGYSKIVRFDTIKNEFVELVAWRSVVREALDTEQENFYISPLTIWREQVYGVVVGSDVVFIVDVHQSESVQAKRVVVPGGLSAIACSDDVFWYLTVDNKIYYDNHDGIPTEYLSLVDLDNSVRNSYRSFWGIVRQTNKIFVLPEIGENIWAVNIDNPHETEKIQNGEAWGLTVSDGDVCQIITCREGKTMLWELRDGKFILLHTLQKYLGVDSNLWKCGLITENPVVNINTLLDYVLTISQRDMETNTPPICGESVYGIICC